MWELEDLESATLKLLESLVEARRCLPEEERDYFSYIPVMAGGFVDGNGIRIEAREEDLDVLATMDFISILKYHGDGHGYNFYITPHGNKAYQAIHESVQSQTENVELDSSNYIDSPAFRARYVESYERWSEVAELLWSAETDTDYSAIGHKCRETMQVFLTELIQRENIEGADPDVAKTIARFKTVLSVKKDELGDARTAFLDALLAYWGVVVDLVQRQAHGGQREAEPLVWEDARRVVFHTAIVMYEIDRTI